MSTYTLSEQPLTAARGRPGSLPMRWQDPAGKAVDITGMAITGSLRWPTPRPDTRIALSISRNDAVNGRFTVAWTGDQVADLPDGRRSMLNVTITDSGGMTHDFDFPVIGVTP